MEIETNKLKEYELNKELFDLLPKQEYTALKADIEKNGIKTELQILPDYTVLCGHQRLRVAKDIGLKTVPVKVVNLSTKEAIEEYVIVDNLLRRHLSPEQRAPLELRLYELEEKKQGRRTDTLSHNETKLDVYQTVADKVGQSRAAVAKHIQYQKEVDARPELKGQKVTAVLRKIRIERQQKEIKALEPVKGEYHVIVIDPPWAGEFEPDGLRGAGNYSTMTMQEIKDIKLPAAEDCVLWVWGVDLYLKETLEIISHWGFERKSTLVWVKDKIGLGHWLRNQHEYCFLAVKGKPVFHGGDIPSVLHAPRREHSEKPEEFYSLVEKASGYKDKLDYFARKKREGWTVYGDEV